MVNLKERFVDLVSDIEIRFDRFRKRFQNRLDNDPVMITPYMGYATPFHIYLRGRVLQDNGIRDVQDNDTIWDNLLNMYRRFETDEIPGAVVRATFDGETVEVSADDEGYFAVDMPHNRTILPHRGTWEVALELVSAPNLTLSEQPITATGEVVVPPRAPDFGVISDLDDTVMKTNAVDILKMARNTLLENAHTRLPFEGVAAFYRALLNGTTSAFNPLYYVSSSPWNLYDMIMDFFAVRNIPTAPIFLRDFGLSQDEPIGADHDAHKSYYIKRLLKHHASLPFILIGDSGQRDPEIYADIVQSHPDRILAVYIRDVTTNDRRDQQVRDLAETIRAHGVDMLLVKDTRIAADHAAENGYIHENTLPTIYKEQNEDSQPPNSLEAAVSTGS